MSLEQAAVPSFANHQTFHPRFGWIQKGYACAAADPGVFLRPDATVTLGVGKNMVNAIRFWSTACRVLTRRPDPERPRISVAVPTDVGRVLLDRRHGWDPYAEHLGTAWVLHWQLVSAQTLVPVWWAVFNDLTALEFTESDLTRFTIDQVAATSWDQPNPSSIDKDVDCLLRMYAPRPLRGRQTLDDLLDSPFRELGLITHAPGGTTAYRFVRGAKPGLSPEIVAYVCLDYLARFDPGAHTVTLTRLLTDVGAPGRLLKLTEDTLLDGLAAAGERLGGRLRLASPAGTLQLTFEGDADRLATDALFTYYQARRGTTSRGELLAAGRAARGEAPLDTAASDAPSRAAGRRRVKNERMEVPR